MGGRGKSRAHNPNLESRPRPRAGRLECVVWRQQAKSGTVAGHGSNKSENQKEKTNSQVAVVVSDV